MDRDTRERVYTETRTVYSSSVRANCDYDKFWHVNYPKSQMSTARYCKDTAKWVLRLSQDNQIKQRRAWLLLGQVTVERSCPCKRPACPAIGGGSEVTFKPLVPRLSDDGSGRVVTVLALGTAFRRIGTPARAVSWPAKAVQSQVVDEAVNSHIWPCIRRGEATRSEPYLGPTELPALADSACDAQSLLFVCTWIL
ncbi:hypothetical protein J6590_009146 [Homalodisca vitripennis]|nr:hypothetical protein J6590_009146 [Homalodisca vitripennis]